ncbi:MAG: tRNA glutamyl-Q(34) synthetase GluQRS [Polyangiaceae bacterium]|nr:tRNA glutamyl-Q(34) synthetase GluQRS [Polyangiaceae bacterium]
MPPSPSRPEPAVVGRLAPSPTGHLHVGHAWAFLLAWWSARARGGRVVLRLEDLDTSRARPALADDVRRELEWLGLDWDAERLQSRGRDRLVAAAEALAARGLAYPCTCTRGDLARSASAPHAGDAEPRYPGTCRDRYTSAAEATRASGRAPCLRLRVPPGPVAFRDEHHGPQAFDVLAEVGDFPVCRRDGVPAYQLAVVVDDAADGVTEVVRGADLLPSTARQLLLQRALSLPVPTWRHVPLVVDAAGRRLAKRSDDLALATLRAAGADPRAIVEWAARAAGLGALGRARADELTPRFSWADVPRAPIRLAPSVVAALLDARA